MMTTTYGGITVGAYTDLPMPPKRMLMNVRTKEIRVAAEWSADDKAYVGLLEVKKNPFTGQIYLPS